MRSAVFELLAGLHHAKFKGKSGLSDDEKQGNITNIALRSTSERSKKGNARSFLALSLNFILYHNFPFLARKCTCVHLKQVTKPASQSALPLPQNFHTQTIFYFL